MTTLRYVVPIGILSRFSDETVKILRLGAIANALLSIVASASTSLSRGVGEKRDTLQSALLSASFLKEAIDILDDRQLWSLIETAVAKGFTLPHPVEHYREVFSRKKGSLYKRLLYELRNKKGFHVDPDHFQQWLNSVTAPEITIWQRDSDAVWDWAFTISMQIQSFYGKRLGDDYDTAKDLGNAPHLVHLVEALCAGLVTSAGYDFRSALRRQWFARVAVRYTFRDGRPPMGDERIVTVEHSGQLTPHSMHELKAHFSAVFRALSDDSRVGWILNPVGGGLMHFRAPRGTADVHMIGPADPPAQPTIPDDVTLFVRLQQAGAAGERQALAAMKLVEAVRDGRATPGEADRLSKEIADSLDYWRTVQQTADAIIERRSKAARNDDR